MDTWVWLLIGAFVVGDAIVTLLVVRHARRKKREKAAGSTDDLSREIGLQ